MSWAVHPLWVEPEWVVEDGVSAAVRRSTIPGMRLAEVDDPVGDAVYDAVWHAVSSEVVSSIGGHGGSGE